MTDDVRRLMFSIAYRMTGSVADAEDLVQDASIRIERARAEGVEIESPQAYASAVVTRLAIDHLRSARVRRETYVGPWLPDPLLVDDEPGPAQHAELADSLSQAFLVVLESLSPVERAVFLLREVFGHPYGEIAGVVGKSEDNTRQLGARARRHVEERRHRFEADRATHAELLQQFVAAAETGDTDELKRLLAADAVLYSDGGGKVSAARVPVHGAEKIARFVANITRLMIEARGYEMHRVPVNGTPGRAVGDSDGTAVSVMTIDIAEGRIQTVYVMRNPDKLRHVRLPAG